MQKTFVLQKGPGRRKLDDKVIEGRLVGYSETAKAYRVRRNDTRKIETTRDVYIDEFTMRKLVSVEIDYINPVEDDREQSRPIISEKVYEQCEMNPPLIRPRERPRKAITGGRGRPRKIYRFVSALSRASSRDNLSANEDVSPEHAEEVYGDVFEQQSDEIRGEKRLLETSLI